MNPRPRIMIVDDDPDLVDLLDAALEDDYEVVTATNGLDALTRAIDYEPDLFIVDIMMPTMTGWELIERLREDPRFHKRPIFVLTAKDARNDMRHGYELGANVYLTKPLSISRLQKNLEVSRREGEFRCLPKKRTIEDIRRLQLVRRDFVLPPIDPLGPASGSSPRKQGHIEQVEDDVDDDEDGLDPFSRADHIYDPPRPQWQPTSASRAAKASGGDKRSHAPVVARILIADDDPDVIIAARELLGHTHQLLEARDGLEAVDKASKYKPDIFIIDGQMPRMSGYQLCEVIHTSEDFHNAPIIFMTGKDIHVERHQIGRFRVHHCLSKPLVIEELSQAVNDIVRHPHFRLRSDRPVWKDVLIRERESIRLERQRHHVGGDRSETQRALSHFLHEEINHDTREKKPKKPRH